MSIKVKGSVRYINYWQPIIVSHYGGKESDIRPIIFDAFAKMNGKKADFKYNHAANGEDSLDHFSVIAHKDGEGDFTFETEKDKKGNYSMIKCEIYREFEKGNSNVMIDTYIDWIFHQLNSRNIILTVSDTSVVIEPDPDKDDVHTVKFYGEGNMSQIDEDTLKNVCKAGTEEACIFVTSGNKISCAKFSHPVARQLLLKSERGQIRATRIGNCKNIGRIPKEE